MSKTQVIYADQFPIKDFHYDQCLLIFDKKLLKSKVATEIIRRFRYKYGVLAGESLKDLQAFPRHVKRINSIVSPVYNRQFRIVAMGGGSTGDFAGFFSSVFKRGVPLIHIPTTWLSALDSAHGGKTALNLSNSKNQIGSFFAAEKVFLIKSLLFAQPAKLADDAMGELFKISVIAGGQLWKKVSSFSTIDHQRIWSVLKYAVKAKYRVVSQDPFEKSGYRQILNFGHTMGHVIEAALGLSHGQAVGQGLVFAARWSLEKGFLSHKNYLEISKSIFYLNFEMKLKESLRRLRKREVLRFILQDKKKSKKDTVHFIFPVKPGLCVRQEVRLIEIVESFEQQKLWI